MAGRSGHFLENIPSLSGVFLAGPPSSYLLSKPLNWLDYDRTYPKNPMTLGEYIRKVRKDRGLFAKDLAKQLRVARKTLTDWEVNGRVPIKRHIERLVKEVEGVERFLSTEMPGRANIAHKPHYRRGRQN